MGVAAIVRLLNVNVLLFVIPEVTADMVIVPAVGARVVLAFTVNTAATEKLVAGCAVGVPTIVNPLNVSVPLFVTPHAVPDIEIVPAVGAKVVVTLTVSVPVTEKFAVGWVVGVPAIVKPLKVSTLLLVIAHVVPVIVTVPPVGANVWLALTVIVATMEKLAEGCIEGVPAIVNPLNVNVPLFVIPQPVPVIVIAPAVGASVMPELTVNIPLTEKLPAVCVVGVAAIVNPLKVKAPVFVMPQPTADIVTVPPLGEKFTPEFTVSAPATE